MDRWTEPPISARTLGIGRVIVGQFLEIWVPVIVPILAVGALIFYALWF